MSTASRDLSFVHLRLHSEYSIVDGLIKIKSLTTLLKNQKNPVCALTDQTNLFGAVKFYTACENAGIKPILGADIWIENSDHKQALPFRATLLCQNLEGYRNLTRLISRAYLEGQQTAYPSIQKIWLENSTAGLIALSGAKDGDIGQAVLSQKPALIKQFLSEWTNLFPERFYLEIQRTGKPGEEIYNDDIINLSLEKKLPLAATNDVRFLTPEDFDAHEARVCIHEGVVLNDPKRARNYTEQQYLKSPEEMHALFADIPQALENTVEIAKRCNLVLPLGKTFLPKFPIPDNISTEDFLSQKSFTGLKSRLNYTSPEPPENYLTRLKIELAVINQMGFAGYFLIVADFIGWAKAQNIPVGPGRGSGAGSLTAYALGITDIDPLPHDLLFERFLNPERVSMPDFDIDFCMDNRDRVIDYVSQKYGRESVSQIITFGTMAAKAVIRDVGRVLGHPYGFVDKIAKLIPFELGMTLDKALQQEAELKELYEKEEEVKLLIDLAKKLEGLTRNAGKHAGGVVIAPSKLTDFTPLYCEAGDFESGKTQLVSQFDKNDVEKAGLVKFDFLGLRTLTIIGWAVDKINQQKKSGQSALNIHQLPLDDPKTYQLIKSCRTTAIFQLESRGIKDLIKNLKPDIFEDIVSLVALFRPGPLQSGMVDDFINRKQGQAKVEYPHPLLEPVLKSTYGIILYQEQVAKIAQILAGYTLGQADLLRSAMGKKKPEEMAKQRIIFVKGAQEKNQLSEKLAASIFDLMEKFAGYGFNKSHSVAYAVITYQTAYLKAHYPEEFMAAVLSSDMDKTDKVVNFLQEARQIGLEISPPDINLSEYAFSVAGKNKIYYGLGAIKGAGESVLSIILDNRKKHGKFKDFSDFLTRIDSRKVNKRLMEALIKSGTLDSLGVSRAIMAANLSDILQGLQKKSAHQKDLFGELTDTAIQLKKTAEWTFKQRLQAEKEVLGFYQSGHPLETYQTEFKPFLSDKLVMGQVIHIKTMFTKRGQRMAFIKLESLEKTLEITVFSDLFETHRKNLIKDNLLLIEGESSEDEFTGGEKLLARQIYSIDEYREKFSRGLIVNFNADPIDNIPAKIKQLSESLLPYKSGRYPVFVEYIHHKIQARFELGTEWKIQLKDHLVQMLALNFGAENIKVIY